VLFAEEWLVLGVVDMSASRITGVPKSGIRPRQITRSEGTSMRPVFAVLLVTVMVVGCASLYLTKGLRTEAGRTRLFPLLRPLMRVINPRVVRAIERRQSSFGLVHHIGRRSGITYRTPVDVAGSSVGVLISLPYGPRDELVPQRPGSG
jgi:hypothetical protein